MKVSVHCKKNTSQRFLYIAKKIMIPRFLCIEKKITIRRFLYTEKNHDPQVSVHWKILRSADFCTLKKNRNPQVPVNRRKKSRSAGFCTLKKVTICRFLYTNEVHYSSCSLWTGSWTKVHNEWGFKGVGHDSKGGWSSENQTKRYEGMSDMTIEKRWIYDFHGHRIFNKK